jgi:hypothetical protein
MTEHVSPLHDRHIGPVRACPNMGCRSAIHNTGGTLHRRDGVEHVGHVRDCLVCKGKTPPETSKALDGAAGPWHEVPGETGTYHRGVRGDCNRQPCAAYRLSVKREDQHPTQTYAEFLGSAPAAWASARKAEMFNAAKTPVVAPPEVMAAGEQINAALRKQTSDGEQALPVKNDMDGCHDRVIDFIASRRDVGIERYGMPLQPMNGRDFARDLREELADALCYLDGLDRNRVAGIVALKRIADLIESIYSSSTDNERYVEYVREIDTVRTALGDA